jgi:hypothetical protein
MFDMEILSWCNKLRLVFFLIVICRIGSVSLLRKWWEVGKMSFSKILREKLCEVSVLQ